MHRSAAGPSESYVMVRDIDGRHHAIRRGAVLVASEANEVGDETILLLPGGMRLRIDEPLKDVAPQLWDAKSQIAAGGRR